MSGCHAAVGSTATIGQTRRHVGPVVDYASAAAYLAAGRGERGKLSRPMGSRNTRLERRSDESIAVRVHATDVVTYCADGCTYLDTGGWESNLTRDRIRAHSVATIGGYRGKDDYYSRLCLYYASNPRTPERWTRCRTCKGTTVSPDVVQCWPRAAHDEHGELIEAPRTPDGYWTGYVYEPCEHGLTEWHEHPDQSCRRCDWTGYANYGSREIPVPIADGLWIDADGAPLANQDRPLPFQTVTIPPHPATMKAHAVHAGLPSGDRVVGDLSTLLPALTAPTWCPDVGCLASAPVESMIQHLNDGHRWTREQVADWLDASPLDFRFPTPTTLED